MGRVPWARDAHVEGALPLKSGVLRKARAVTLEFGLLYNTQFPFFPLLSFLSASFTIIRRMHTRRALCFSISAYEGVFKPLAAASDGAGWAIITVMGFCVQHFVS